MTRALRKTPLHAAHQKAGGKMVPFAGFEMPVQYPTGIRAEHEAVRTACGLFDVSHMGEFRVSGPEALALIQKVSVNDASVIEVGQAQYSAMCREDGGILDDLLIYRAADHYMIVVNASNLSKDWDWIAGHAEDLDADLQDLSDSTALLALQGPLARDVLRKVTDDDIDAIRYYRFASGEVAGRPAMISATGYTGEDGFELYLDAGDAAAVWGALLEAGTDQGLVPAGLGARDSLRLEAGYALYGNDLDEDHTPLEAGLGWITKLGKGDFIGSDALRRQKEAGVERKLVGLIMQERSFPRPGYEIASGGEVVGTVTSGVLSPTLGYGIAMAYVPAALADAGTEVAVLIRGKEVPAEVVKPRFYTSGSIKR